MGLDLVYGINGLSKKENKELNKKLNALNCNEEFGSEVTNNIESLSIYYRLNWNGVRLESNYILIQFLKSKIKNVNNVIENEKYVNTNSGKSLIAEKTEYDTKNTYLLYSEVKDYLEENEDNLPMNALSFLSFANWKGDNGSEFKIKMKDEKLILTENEEILHVDIEQELKMIQNRYQITKNFLKDYKECDYIIFKSAQIFIIFDFFFEKIKTNKNIELFAYFG